MTPPRGPAPRPVLITGAAVISPFGCGLAEFWDGLTGGVIATGPVRRFSTSCFASGNGGEVPGFTLAHLAQVLSASEAGRLPLSVRYAVAVVGAALRDAGLDGAGEDLAGTGICMGTVMGTRPHVERYAATPAAAVATAGAPAADIASVPGRLYGLGEPRLVLASGCSAGNDAIGHAYDLIASGAADRMVAGGAEELSECVYALFTGLRALSADEERPFDAQRTGILPAEGAAALVLESRDSARARGARAYARLLGYAAAADAYHLTSPHPEGRALVRVLRDAIARSGCAVDDVAYVNAHGTGTPVSDRVEAAALARFFGPGHRPAVSSIKGAIGHAQGAAGALEAIACMLAIRDGVIPGMPTLRQPDPECAVVDLVAGDARPARVGTAVSVAFGFGGATSALVLGAA